MGHLCRRGRPSRIRATAENQPRFPLFARTFRLSAVSSGLRGARNGGQAKRTGHEHHDNEECDSTRRCRYARRLRCSRDRHGKPVVGYAGSVNTAAVRTAASNQVTDVRHRGYRHGYYGRGYRHGYYGRGYRHGYYGRGYRRGYYGGGYRRGYYGGGYRRGYYGGGYGYPYGGNPYPYSYSYPFGYGWGGW